MGQLFCNINTGTVAKTAKVREKGRGDFFAPILKRHLKHKNVGLIYPKNQLELRNDQ